MARGGLIAHTRPRSRSHLSMPFETTFQNLDGLKIGFGLASECSLGQALTQFTSLSEDPSKNATHRLCVFRSWCHDWRRRVVVVVVIAVLATRRRRGGALLARLQRRQRSTVTNVHNRRLTSSQSLREADELGAVTHRRRVFV